MAFEKIKKNTDELQDRAKEYIDANIAYYKLYGFKIAMKSTTLMLKLFLLSIMLVIVTLFFSIALALAIGYGLDNFAYGFLIVGGIYLVLAILVYYVQDKIVEGPILRTFSNMLFKNIKNTIMEITKSYSSYEEINRELQILKVEKDLAFEKMNLSFMETKDSFTAKNIVGTVPGIALNILGALSEPLKNVGIAYFTKKIFRM